jgi:hypothetical protein
MRAQACRFRRKNSKITETGIAILKSGSRWGGLDVALIVDPFGEPVESVDNYRLYHGPLAYLDTANSEQFVVGNGEL